MAKADKLPSATDQQRRAWEFYGWRSGTANSADRTRDTSDKTVGEVRYVLGWISDQMGRLAWNIKIDGQEEWTLSLPDGGTATNEEPQDVLDLIGWTPKAIREITTNLFVAGQLDYIAIEEGNWRVVSVVDSKRDDLISGAAHTISALWSHPADATKPDAPLFGVLPILDELDWINRLSKSQSANRISMRGILAAADGLSAANGGDFWVEFEAATKTRMQDPTDVSPLILRGALELVEPAGDGVKGLSWIIPEFPYNEHLDQQADKLIRRLAYGLPIPPEIVFGLQAQSRATAFQVEENSYRAHIQPPALIVADVAQRALQVLLPETKITVHPDPTELLARRNSVQDTKDALAAGAVGFTYYRKVLGIPEDAAATEEDLAIMERIRNAKVGAKDPANVAADEGLSVVLASVGGPGDQPLEPDEIIDLSRFLADLDNSLMMELAGATVQATERAREKLGANVRSRENLRSSVPTGIPNNRVATHLKVAGLVGTGIPVEDIIRDSLAPLRDWWGRRAEAAQNQVQNFLGPDARADFTIIDAEKSAEALVELCGGHVLATIEAEDTTPLDAEARMRVLTILGGG